MHSRSVVELKSYTTSYVILDIEIYFFYIIIVPCVNFIRNFIVVREFSTLGCQDNNQGILLYENVLLNCYCMLC